MADNEDEMPPLDNPEEEEVGDEGQEVNAGQEQQPAAAPIPAAAQNQPVQQPVPVANAPAQPAAPVVPQAAPAAPQAGRRVLVPVPPVALVNGRLPGMKDRLRAQTDAQTHNAAVRAREVQATADRGVHMATGDLAGANVANALGDITDQWNEAYLNGGLFEMGEAGERLSAAEWQRVYFSNGLSRPAWILNGVEVAAGTANAVLRRVDLWRATPRPNLPGVGVTMTVEEMRQFAIYNAYMILTSATVCGHLGLNAPAANNTPGLQTAEAWKVVYEVVMLRLGALIRGLISPNWPAEQYFCTYNNAVVLTATEEVNSLTWWRDQDVGYRNAFLGGVRQTIMNFENRVNNIICLLAYGFRSRGHHYTKDMDAAYKNVWRHCIMNQQALDENWKAWFTSGLHAIYPIVLDEYWLSCVELGCISGAMQKRINVAAAGTAIWGALDSAAQDVCTVFPQLRDQLAQPLELCRVTAELCRNNRWLGSVNRSYYNAQALNVDEGQLKQLGSVVMAIYKEIEGGADITNSKALARVAKQAPLAGKVFGTFATLVLADPETARTALSTFAQQPNP